MRREFLALQAQYPFPISEDSEILRNMGEGLRIPTKGTQVPFSPRQYEKRTFIRFFFYIVGAPGFEPGVARSQSENVSRYTTPR